jgi:hypothetical protein
MMAAGDGEAVQAVFNGGGGGARLQEDDRELRSGVLDLLLAFN